MPLATSKEELLQHLQQAYAKLDAEFDDVTDELARQRGIEGDISCCDVLAYQIGWGRLLLGWESAEQRGKVPDMPAPGFKWNQLGELAGSFYAAASGQSLSQLRAEFELVVKEVETWIQSLGESTLFETGQRRWTGKKWPIAKWVQVNTVAPYRSARTKLRRWKKENASL